MLELWLIRHGETEWNREGRWQGQSDPPLNDAGRSQAAALARRLAGEGFDRVIASDLDRARTTASLALPGVEAELEPRLRELNFGDFEGRIWHELVAEHGPLLDQWRCDPYAFKPPGGESFEELVARSRAWLNEVAGATGRVAVFTHGGTLRALLHGIVGVPDDRTWGFVLDNACINVLTRQEGMYLISRVNDTAHLAPAPR